MDLEVEKLESISPVENMIEQLIRQKVNENSFLDYKQIEYSNDNKGKMELIKDVIAMLNCEESFEKDKFIIFGVVNENLYAKGIDSMRDDNEFQNDFDLITPRPTIGTGQVDIEGKHFGFIFIGRENTDRPYTVKRDCIYPTGTSFIRVGTTNRGLPDEVRKEFMFSRFLSQKEPSQILQQIELKNELRKTDYSSEGFAGEREIDPSLNDGLFVIGKNEYTFNIKFQVASNNLSRIYNDAGIRNARWISDIEFGEISMDDIELSDVDFSSNIVDYGLEDISIIINDYGKVLLLVFVDMGSKSHGAPKDMVKFKWKILK
ncbi:helix-turn-helix domain-containing protein [Enterococcus devriesei]|uniref:AlbA family DNA-binding domain-containing protein n=1 Tax=Enterococcus devriesei TaxID=319970 RepID=UPI0036D29494